MIKPVLILIRTSKILRKLGVFIFQTFQFEAELILILVLYSIQISNGHMLIVSVGFLMIIFYVELTFP